MKRYQITHEGNILARKAKEAKTFGERLMGLMFLKKMDGYDGLIISPCNSIHTFFMKMNIDVIFLNNKNEVVHIKRSMKPWRMTRMFVGANKVLEFEAGVLGENIKAGDKISLCIN